MDPRVLLPHHASAGRSAVVDRGTGAALLRREPTRSPSASPSVTSVTRTAIVDLEDGGIAWLLSRELLQAGLDGPRRRRRRPAVAGARRDRRPLPAPARAVGRGAVRALARDGRGLPAPDRGARARAAPRAPCSTSTTSCTCCCPTAGRTRRAADLRRRSGTRLSAAARRTPLLGGLRARRLEFSTQRGRGSAGRASPCQGEGRGFESRRPLGTSGAGRETGARVRWSGREARQRPAKPSTRVQIPSPPRLPRSTSAEEGPAARPGRAIGAAVARFPDTEEVTGSIPVSPTSAEPQAADGRLGLFVPGICAALTRRPAQAMSRASRRTARAGPFAARRRARDVRGVPAPGPPGCWTDRASASARPADRPAARDADAIRHAAASARAATSTRRRLAVDAASPESTPTTLAPSASTAPVWQPARVRTAREDGLVAGLSVEAREQVGSCVRPGLARTSPRSTDLGLVCVRGSGRGAFRGQNAP